MKKINKVAYNKLCLQAEEAKALKINKLADNIYSAIGPIPDEEKYTYSYKELNVDVHKEMWKIATNVLHYYDLESIDAKKLDETLQNITNNFIKEIKASLLIEEDEGAREPIINDK